MIDDKATIYQTIGDGTTTLFNYPAPLFEVSDLSVEVDSVPATNITVTLKTADGRPADLVNPVTNADVVFDVAPALDAVVSLRSNLEFDQDTDYQPFERFPADLFELSLDRIVLLCQQLRDRLAYAISLDPDLPLPTYTIVFPEWEAGRGLQWDDTEPGKLNNVAFATEDYVNQAISDLSGAVDAQIAGLQVQITANTDAVAAVNVQVNNLATALNDVSIRVDNLEISDTAQNAAIVNLENTKLDSVVAGDNISIDLTDPLNPVITGLGGGIFSQDTPPANPDGKNFRWIETTTNREFHYFDDTWVEVGTAKYASGATIPPPPITAYDLVQDANIAANAAAAGQAQTDATQALADAANAIAAAGIADSNATQALADAAAALAAANAAQTDATQALADSAAAAAAAANALQPVDTRTFETDASVGLSLTNLIASIVASGALTVASGTGSALTLTSGSPTTRGVLASGQSWTLDDDPAARIGSSLIDKAFAESIRNKYASKTSDIRFPNQTTVALINQQANTLELYDDLDYTPTVSGNHRISVFYSVSSNVGNALNDIIVTISGFAQPVVVDNIYEAKDTTGAGITANIIESGVVVGNTSTGTDVRELRGAETDFILTAGTTYNVKIEFTSRAAGAELCLYSSFIAFEQKEQNP